MMEQTKKESKCYPSPSAVQRNSWLANGAFDYKVNLFTSRCIQPVLRLARNALTKCEQSTSQLRKCEDHNHWPPVG